MTQTQPFLRKDGKPDRRPLRAVRTKQRLIDAVRLYADEGNYRPHATQIAMRARISQRSIFMHFDTLAELQLAALTDEHVRVLCARLAMLAPRERLRCIVSGQMPVLPS